ncbi:MAG: trans-2-enoyl-CoA reductase family protein [Firmicutes bacterium]|nr:trans-2-enoyl-CoA reductase family protein [Bacillota bacterium]
MIIKPRVKGFICLTAHPDGASRNVDEQIRYIKDNLPKGHAYKSVLILGGTTGYGLASAIAASFGGDCSIGQYTHNNICCTKVLVVGYFQQANSGKTASVGMYNVANLIEQADKHGKWVKSISCDAFSDRAKELVAQVVSNEMDKLDLIIYSLAAPKRTNPISGTVHKSVLKPIGQVYTSKNLNTDTGEVGMVTLQPATEQECEDTVSVMGGEDWKMWIDYLSSRDLISTSATNIAYSYIGPKLTHPIYKDGTIGKAKLNLKYTADQLNKDYEHIGLKSFVSIQKALVTQASSAIPVVPLYISILYDIMKKLNTHEHCIEQITRLFKLLNDGVVVDCDGYIRLDDWEMSPQVQQEISRRWEIVNTDNLKDLADLNGYKADFLKLFGFGYDDIDYDRDVDEIASEKNIIFG